MKAQLLLVRETMKKFSVVFLFILLGQVSINLVVYKYKILDIPHFKAFGAPFFGGFGGFNDDDFPTLSQSFASSKATSGSGNSFTEPLQALMLLTEPQNYLPKCINICNFLN